jgi:hypothetical protein
MGPRVRLLIAGACASVLACGSPQRATLSKAGDERDDGAGQLAQASLRLATPGERDDESGFTEEQRAVQRYDPAYGAAYGGDPYGGAPYGGATYGGATYAGWVVPQWTYAPPVRIPRYNVIAGLRGAIEGTVTWAGPPPVKVTSACGPIDNPTLRVGTDKAARGVIVYIEKVAVGRAVPIYARPAGIGGAVAKRGCALVPAAQIVAPLPASFSIHGDEQRTRLRIVHDKTPSSVHDLQEGGLVQVEVKAGLTRVEAEGGKLSPAWILGLETPYYAITDDAGHYRIDELAPGSYELTFWQPPVAVAGRDGTFSYGAPVVAKKSVTVGAGATAAKLSISIGR